MIPTALTCLSCRAQFTEAAAQRAHYAGEWHRYNLQRRVAGFEPVGAAVYEQRAEAARVAAAPSEPTSQHCAACRKHFGSANAFNNHLASRKHRMAVANAPEEPEAAEEAAAVQPEPEEDDDGSSFEEINDIFPNDCLFCDHHSKTIVKNLTHMSTVHSFFIPDAEYCVDLKGFLTYLGEKVSQGFMCLWCDDKGRMFYSIEAAQAHMRDKGHCKVLHEGSVLAEYGNFYDYSSSYPDHVEGDEDMEVVPDENALLTSKTEDDEEYQLVLPSGAVIGHRSLMRYYKQNLTAHTGAVVRKSDDKLRRVISQYRSLGWAPLQSEAVAKKIRDIKYMRRVQNKWSAQLGIKANKLQTHFRQQVNY